MTSDTPVIGWIVDVQNDFMCPPEEGGRLYVTDPDDPDDPGARAARPAIERAVSWLRQKGDALVFTGDWHGREDAEIDETDPDFETTFPPHCMGRSEDPAERAGAAIVDTLRPTAPVTLVSDAGRGAASHAARLATESGAELFVQKIRFDVFRGNAGADELVEALVRELAGKAPGTGEPLFVVCGVARDVCVTQAVDGLLDRNRRVAVLRDATWGLGLEAEDETLERWRSAGAEILTVADLTERQPA